MSIAGIEYKHVFGLKPTVNSGLNFLDDQTVIYPAGSNLVFYNHENKSQRFIHLSDKSDAMSATAISPNKRWLAVAETGKKPQIVIHELTTFRKRKVLQCPPEIECKEIISMSFSGDAKYLVTQSNGPDWMLTFWSWEKGKVLASIRTTNPPEKNLNLMSKDQQKDSTLGQVVYQWYNTIT
jgi:WD40 repeat protein